MMQDGHSDRAATHHLELVAQQLGSRLCAASFVARGDTMDTHRIELDDGRVLAAQRLRGGAAARRAATAGAVASRVAAAGVPVPLPTRVVRVGRVSWLIAPWVEGDSGRKWLDTAERSRRLATRMGALAVRLARVDAADLDLERGWETANGVGSLTEECLARLGGVLTADEVRALQRAATVIRTSLAGAVPVFAHGDLAPVNVILAPDGTVRAVLDFESARRSMPLFDTAWWGWIMRFHHPATWARTWPLFLEAAGIADDRETTALIEAIQRVRCLELAARTPAARSRTAWLGRLRTTLQWPAPADRPRP